VKNRKPLKLETEPAEPLELGVEVCLNPWNGVCKNTDIAVYICRDGRTLPICRECWREIGSTDVEWRFN